MDRVMYRYELCSSNSIVATGHESREEALEAGAQIEIGGYLGVVRTVEPLLGDSEMRLVVQVLTDR